MTIIAVANQKGGVGKTTTTVNVAHWFAQQGYKVLVVDFDVQGHCSTCLGLPKGNGLFRLMVNEEAVGDVVVTARPNLDLVTGGKWTERIKTFLADRVGRDLVIASLLDVTHEVYDLVLLDLAPGSDILHVGSLVASDFYLIPAKMDFLALDGVVEVMRTVTSLEALPTVEPPKLIGVVPTLYDRTTRETDENLQSLAKLVGMEAVLYPIPMDTHVREASSRGMTIWEYAPDSAAAVGYAVKAGDGRARNSRGNLGGYLHLAETIQAVVR